MSILVTGATGGIGLAAATELAASGAEVILAGRDPARLHHSHAAVGDRARLGPRAVRTLDIDLASLGSVRDAAVRLHERGETLGGVVLCAGVNTRTMQLSADGHELTFAVNVLAHALLLHLVLDLIDPPARIVIVSSGTHDPTTLDGRPAPPVVASASRLADPATAPADGQVRYSTSKLADLMLAYEFSRRLHEARISTVLAPVTVNAFDPGAVPGTGLTREWSRTARAGVLALRALRFLPVNVHSLARSSAALANLVTDPALEGESGRYFGVRGPKLSSPDSYDQRRAVDLFHDITQLIGLAPSESLLLQRTAGFDQRIGSAWVQPAAR